MMLTPLSETPTPEETALEGLLAGYLEEVTAHGLTWADAARLEALVHTKGPPRVIALQGGPGEGTEEAPFIAAPGAGLFAFTKQERAELLRLTREHYAAPGTDLAALHDLYDKTRRTPQQRKAERARLGWAKIPTWTEWATAKGEDRRGVSYGAARLGGGWTSSLRPTKDWTYSIPEDDSYAIWRPETIEGALAVIEAAKAQTAKPRRDNAPRSLRQGSNFLEGITHGALSASKALSRKREHRTGLVSDASREALDLFRYEPLTWAERLAVTALANIALSEKRLEESPAALSRRPLEDAPQQRIRIPFPGYSELAKWCGATPGDDGRMPRGLTKALKAALESLTTSARWITEPVLVRDREGHLAPRYRVTQAQWVELTTLYPSGEIAMDLHPAAVGSILASYVERAPNLYDRHEAARKAIGAREMRNEWSILEDYLLRRAQIAAGDAFAQSLPENAREGKAKKDARAAAKLALTDHGPAEGERTVTVVVSRSRLWELLKLDTVAKKQGKREALERERDAFAFCQATKTLLTLADRIGKQGDTVFVCTMPHPDRAYYDPAQLTMLPPGPLEEAGV